MSGSVGALGSELFVLESQRCLQYWPQSCNYSELQLHCLFLVHLAAFLPRIYHSKINKFFSRAFWNNYTVAHPVGSYAARSADCLPKAKARSTGSSSQMSCIRVSNQHALTGTDSTLDCDAIPPVQFSLISILTAACLLQGHCIEPRKRTAVSLITPNIMTLVIRRLPLQGYLFYSW